MAVIKGRSRAGGGLAKYMMGSKGDNDEVELLSIQNCVFKDDWKLAAKEMEDFALGSRSSKPFYHGQLSLGKEESKEVTNEQYVDMVGRIMKKLECPENTKVIISKHTKNDGCHIHYGFLRHNPETGKLLSDSNNYYKHDDARKEIEDVYNLTPTPRRHTRKEQYQDAALSAWQKARTGQEFVDSLKEQGLYVAVSVQESRPYRLMDDAGRSSNLVRDMRGVKTAEVRERLKDVKLPLDTEVRDQLKQSKRYEAVKSDHKETAEQVTRSPREQYQYEQELERIRRKEMNKGRSI